MCGRSVGLRYQWDTTETVPMSEAMGTGVLVGDMNGQGDWGDYGGYNK